MPHGLPPLDIRLRHTLPADVPILFQFQLDPVSNQLAGTKPRDPAAFQARWDEILRDPAAARVTPRVILVDDAVVGQINIVRQEGVNSIGYWIAREHWGRGIATRAIALLVAEVEQRPLVAQVAVHNAPSRRALERNGFVVTSRSHYPESERSVAREMYTLTLA